MEFTVLQIAQILDGQVEGDGNRKVSSLAKIQEATSGTISFLSNPKYESFIYETKASAVIVGKDFTPKEPVEPTLIRVNDPYSAFSILLEEYYKLHSFRKNGVENPSYLGESSTTGENIYRGAFSYISTGCKIGNNVKIYPHVYIGDNVTIGNNTIIYAGVKIFSDTVIGNYCTIQAGAVVGSDGFGFAPQADGTYKAVPQVGNVIIEDHVDIGANTVIDCATMGSTIIKEGAKLDNLIQVAHNVEIGENTVIAAQAGISGSSKIGENCMIGGQVGIVGHISIANRTNIGAQSGISKSIKQEGKSFSGSPSNELKQQLKYYTIFKKLPEMLKRIEELEEKVIHLFPFEN